ncbi:MAG: lytic transglycosylase domain-containing protein [Pyrinomonadaceae bacterium]
MRRYLFSISVILVLVVLTGSYFFNDYWIHRYDGLILRQAGIYRLDSDLVWSIIYEETYFRGWRIGAADEIGLMQVTPAVAREWARATGFQEFEKRAATDVVEFLREPERNIQVGCWYLEKLREEYRGFPAETAMTLAAYNAGASRVDEWSGSKEQMNNLSEEEFISKIDIASTRSYVVSILERYRSKKKATEKEKSGQKAVSVNQ